jgi:hypothetical protein
MFQRRYAQFQPESFSAFSFSKSTLEFNDLATLADAF